MNPVYGKEEIQSVTDYLNSGGWIMEHTKTRELEQMICEYTGATYAHMVPSATAGLLIAAMLADIKHGEQVAVSAWTQAATINGAVSIGAAPQIMDIDRAGVINFRNIPDYIKVVFVTSINGRYGTDTVANIKRLREAGVFVIEDAAQSLGSFTAEGHIGTFGNVGVFSFGAPKIITTGQGGCIVTNDKKLSERIVEIKNFGRSIGMAGETYNVHGLNFKFTDLQAAFGIEQMRKLPDIVNNKKRIYDRYCYELSKPEWAEHMFFIDTDLTYATPTYPDIYFKKPYERDRVAELLKEKNIGYRLVYSSLSSQPYHNRWARPTPQTDDYAKKGIQLPAQADLTDDDIDKIIDVIKGYYTKKKYNPANDKILDMLKAYAYKNTDKLCLVLAGQPRFIGSTIWENNFVGMLKATVEEHPIEIDITYVLPEYDTLDKSFYGHEDFFPGLPIDTSFTKELDRFYIRDFFYNIDSEGKKIGKIKIKKDKIEKYIKEKLNFVSNIEFVYYDPYKFVNEVEQVLEYEVTQNSHKYTLKEKYAADLDHTSWLTQHLSPLQAYIQRQDFFDSLSDDTPIIKMRHDYHFSQSMFTDYQSITLWNLIVIHHEGYLSLQSSLIRNSDEFKKGSPGPQVVFESTCPEFVFGKMFASDFYHMFNREGFKIYVEEFFDWVAEDLMERSSGLLSENFFKDEYKSYHSLERRIVRKPEVLINDFFMQNKFSMKYSGIYFNILSYRDGSLMRWHATEQDHYRYMWYEWTAEMLKDLTTCVNRSINFD
jgi:perosamine synthetase